MRNYLILVVLISCSHNPRVDLATLNPWIGLPVQKLELHPYFSRLTTKTDQVDKKLIRDYRERSPTQSKARCVVVGCQYENTIDCHNIFEIEADVIVSARREGVCRPHGELLPIPHDDLM